MNFEHFELVLPCFYIEKNPKSNLAGWRANFHENYMVFKMKCVIIDHNKGIWSKTWNFLSVHPPNLITFKHPLS